jgi:hypothetical protein
VPIPARRGNHVLVEIEMRQTRHPLKNESLAVNKRMENERLTVMRLRPTAGDESLHRQRRLAAHRLR